MSHQQDFKVISSEVFYNFGLVDFILSIREGLILKCIYLVLGRQCFETEEKRRDKQVQYENNFYLSVPLASALLSDLPSHCDMVEELKHNSNPPKRDPTFKDFCEISNSKIYSNDRQEYFLGVQYNTKYSNYYMALKRREIGEVIEPASDKPFDFLLTLPAACALFRRLKRAITVAKQLIADRSKTLMAGDKQPTSAV